MLSTSLSYNLITRDLGRSLTRVENQPMVARETAYFQENIGKVTSVKEFVADSRLFNYAMKAFGLQDMAYAKAFMVKAMEEGVSDPNSFANRLSDKRYAEFVKAFNFAQYGEDAIDANPAVDGTAKKYIARMTMDGVLPESAAVKAETAYFKTQMAKEVRSIDDFLADDRLYKYAMFAFDIDAEKVDAAFMRKVLEGGVSDPKSFANQQSDKKFAEFAATFNFMKYGEELTTRRPAVDGAVSGYMRQTLEENAGAQNEGVRLALYFERKAPDMNSFMQVLADPAMAQVVRTALGLPDSFAQADIDKQAALFEKRLNIEDFKDPEALSKFLRRFTAMWEVSNVDPISTSPALAILSQSGQYGISSDTLAAIALLKR